MQLAGARLSLVHFITRQSVDAPNAAVAAAAAAAIDLFRSPIAPLSVIRHPVAAGASSSRVISAISW